MRRFRLVPHLTIAAGLGILLFLGAQPHPPARAARPYTILDLGTLGGAISRGNAINARGEVAGTSETATGAMHAFLFDGKTMIDLGTLGKNRFSDARAINDSGQVAGDSFSGGFDTNSHAFLYDAAGMHDLGTNGGDRSAARGINASGQVVGIDSSADGQVAVIHDTGGGTRPLAPPNAFAGNGINDGGHTTGFISKAGAHHAFMTDSSGLHDLGTLPGDKSSYALAINGADEVVGCSSNNANRACHAFAYEHGNMLALGALPGTTLSEAEAVNSAGQVVGMSYSVSGPTHAFLWTADGGLVDLNQMLPPASGWNLMNATGINSHGQITGWGTKGGPQRAFLLTPQ